MYPEGGAVSNVTEGTRGNKHVSEGSEREECTISPTCNFPCQSPVSMCVTGRFLCFGSISHFLLPIPPLTHPGVLTTLQPLWPSLSSSHLLSLYLPQWCERNELCRRLQLRDLLVAPLQRLTRYPLLLRNMAKRCRMDDETKGLQSIAEQVDTSICELTTPRLTPVILKHNWLWSHRERWRRLVEPMRRCRVNMWLCLFSYYWQAKPLWCHQSHHDRHFSLVRCVWSTPGLG